MNSNDLGKLPDRELLAESRAYEAHLTLGGEENLNLDDAANNRMTTANDAFEASLDAWDAVQLESDGKQTTKNAARKALLTEFRAQRNLAYADASISDAALSAAGMPPRDTVKTDSPSPTTAPIGIIDYGKLKHTIYFRDAATPDSEAKPQGMQSCEIWRYIGTAAPTTETDYEYVADDTNSPYTCFYQMADAGKKVWYLLRWKSKNGDVGEWSETIEATVNG